MQLAVSLECTEEKRRCHQNKLSNKQKNEVSPLSPASLAALPIGAVTQDTFTVVNDPFTAGNWRSVHDWTFPR